MKNFAKTWFGALCAALVLAALGGLFALGVSPPVRAQTYPVTNPIYTPNPTLPAATITVGSASSYVFQTNGVSTMYLRIAGSPSGLIATVQVTESRTGTIAWSNTSEDEVGIGRVSTITAAGLYRVNVAGVAQVRLNVTQLTSGTTTVAFAAGAGDFFVTQLPAVKATYSGAAAIATGATTHFLSLAGSATKTIQVTRVACQARATAAVTVGLTAEVDSTADSGDAGTAVTGTPHDSNFPAPTAVLLSHTTSPTPGTLVGLVRAGSLSIAALATPATDSGLVAWEFGTRPGSDPVVLRGVAQSFSLNASAAFGSGGLAGCDEEWTEE